MSVIALPSAALGARLKETVTAGNWPWCVIASGSVVRVIFAKAARGICSGWDEPLPVFGVVVEEVVATAVPGAESTSEEGVYCTLEV